MTTGMHRPRNYGEPTDRGYEIAMDAHTDKVAAVRSEAGQRLLNRLIDQMPDLLKDDDLGVNLEDFRDEARGYAILIQDTLPRCEPIYVTSDVVTILDSARQKLPPFELRENDLLVPNGFVWLETPIPDFWEDGLGLAGFAWMTGAESKNIFAWMFPTSNPYTGMPTSMAFPGEGETVDYEFPLARLLVAFWLLAKEKLLTTKRERVSRAVRRRAARVRQIETVVVIALRKSNYLGPEGSSDGSRKIGRDHRYLVRGFWRNQWYPSEGRNKPKWINDFLKGDPDKPVVAKRRAFEFRR